MILTGAFQDGSVKILSSNLRFQLPCYAKKCVSCCLNIVVYCLLLLVIILGRKKRSRIIIRSIFKPPLYIMKANRRALLYRTGNIICSQNLQREMSAAENWMYNKRNPEISQRIPLNEAVGGLGTRQRLRHQPVKIALCPRVQSSLGKSMKWT